MSRIFARFLLERKRHYGTHAGDFSRRQSAQSKAICLIFSQLRIFYPLGFHPGTESASWKMEDDSRNNKRRNHMNMIRYKTPELAAWMPFDRLSPLRELLDSALSMGGPAGLRAWAPVLDVYENADSVTVQVELAGMKKEDFEISLEEDTLTIAGERKRETGGERGESFRSERSFGTFRRAISLPAPVKGSEVRATYENGILTITLPKADEAKPRKIEVHLS